MHEREYKGFRYHVETRGVTRNTWDATVRFDSGLPPINNTEELFVSEAEALDWGDQEARCAIDG